MFKKYENDDEMNEYLKHRFDDEIEREQMEQDTDDESLEDIEDREYWANVLSDELRKNK